MDPNATWKMIEDAMSARDREAVAESADALIGWLERGGFKPSPTVSGRMYSTKEWLVYLRDIRHIAEM